MKAAIKRLTLTRRKFSFWLSMGLFTLGETVRVSALDRWAAAIIGETSKDAQSRDYSMTDRPEHWTVTGRGNWRWFERETQTDRQWVVTGVTRPVDITTGERFDGNLAGLTVDFLDDEVVPEDLRPSIRQPATVWGRLRLADQLPGQTNLERRERHGRPPSRWIRSLHAEELKVWLKTIRVPEVGVSGMTFWTHLTRDHSFDPVLIKGLTVDEQAKLHSAAHYGY